MRVLILGGTGPAGLALIREALSNEHTVVIYARSPQKLPESITSNPAVTIIEGQLTDAQKLAEALSGTEAVLSALGPTIPSHPSGTPLAHAYSLLIDIMKQQHITRLIALGTPSIRDEHDKFSLTWSILITGVATFARNAYKDIVAVGETIRNQGDELEWTIVRVPFLTNGDSKNVMAGYIGDGKTGTTLPRVGFAAFVIEELAKKEWNRNAPLIATV